MTHDDLMSDAEIEAITKLAYSGGKGDPQRDVRRLLMHIDALQASRATSNALPMEVYETLDMFMSLYRAKGWEGDAAYERAELLIAASAPKGDGND